MNMSIEEFEQRRASTNQWLGEMKEQLLNLLDRSRPITLTNHPEARTQEQIEKGFRSCQ